MLATVLVAHLMGQSAPQPVTELVSSVKAAAPGKPFIVALHMKLPTGWHNYYANPGESGMPTTIAWTLPEGYTAGPIQWPVPKREVTGGIPNFVYEGDLWLLSTITPSKTAKPGPIELKAKADWLLCQANCVPQSATLSLKLQVARTAQPSGNGLISVAERRLPQREHNFSLSAVVADKSVVLGLQDRSGRTKSAVFFPADPEAFNADPEPLTPVTNGVQIKIPLNRYASAAPARLTGILVLPRPHGVQTIVEPNTAFWIDVPVAK